uniref:Ribonuclease A-domain domain-containing protein n=1 Tax=Pygocentrus nattereri TaxID=42514 RepID=A0A3B4EFP7_PYGNA
METHFTLVLLLVLCAVLPTDGQTERAFRRKHVKPYMTPRKCNSEMARLNRHMSRRANKTICKPVNTFILAGIKTVRQVCTNGINLRDNYFQSNRKFKIVKCLLKKNSRPPKCNYRGEKKTQPIFVACDQNYRPVHYGPPPNGQSGSR